MRPVLAFVFALTMVSADARAWDSARFPNPSHATHSYLVECGLETMTGLEDEVAAHSKALKRGANTELHELESGRYEKRMDRKYGFRTPSVERLEARRLRHRGTNEGSADVEGWWKDSLEAYRSGNKRRAYFLLGVLLHMVQDMGVPAHAHHIYHQGTRSEFDPFEFLALKKWRPIFGAVDREDPRHAEPWKYYHVSQEWTQAYAPNYDPAAFPKTWRKATDTERAVVQNQQGRTCHVVAWTLQSAAAVFSRIE